MAALLASRLAFAGRQAALQRAEFCAVGPTAWCRRRRCLPPQARRHRTQKPASSKAPQRQRHSGGQPDPTTSSSSSSSSSAAEAAPQKRERPPAPGLPQLQQVCQQGGCVSRCLALKASAGTFSSHASELSTEKSSIARTAGGP